MKISELFKREIARPINGVVKADQLDEESIWQELDEFVVTKELDGHLRKFFERYCEAIDAPNDPNISGKIGVWVSGFFGSGKSHFIKVLSHLLDNEEHVHDGQTKRAVDFFDDKIGIYVKGTNTSYERKRYNANYGEDWERPVHVEFFEADGTLGFSIDAGVKIIGLAGRTYPRKGMALFARSEYGYSEINYRIFPDLPIEEFTALVLRNSGRDLVDHSTLFRDELCQALVEDLDVDLIQSQNRAGK